MSAATTYTFTGSATVSTQVATTYTVSLGAGTDAGVVITPATTGTGVFAPTSVSLSTGTPTLTFTYTPTYADRLSAPTLSTTNNGALTDPSSIVLTVNQSYIFTGPLTRVYVGAPKVYAVELKSGDSLAAPVTFTPATDGAGVISPATIVLSATTKSAIFTYTPVVADIGSSTHLSVTNGSTLTNPSSLNITVLDTPVDLESVVLSWSAAGGATTNYIIYRNGQQVGQTHGLTFTHAPRDKKNVYRVQAVDRYGSNVTSGTTVITMTPSASTASVTLT